MQGEIRIGLFRWLQQQTFFKSLALIKESYPKISFYVRYLEHKHIEAAILRDEIDLGFAVFIRNRQAVCSTPYLDQKNVLVASPEYLSKIPPPCNLRQFNRHTIVDYDHEATGFRVLLQKNKIPIKKDFKANIVISEPDGALEAIRAGLGIGFCPVDLVNDLQVIPWPKENGVTAGIELIYKNREYPQTKVEKIAEKLIELSR